MKNSAQFSAPPPVTIPVLREHFKVTYKLNDEQVELMIQSSRKSLEATLGAARRALLAEDVYPPLVKAAHNLKGLLLNMGQDRWAEFARDMEQSAKSCEEKDYEVIIRAMVVGVEAVIEYFPEIKE